MLVSRDGVVELDLHLVGRVVDQNVADDFGDCVSEVSEDQEEVLDYSFLDFVDECIGHSLVWVFGVFRRENRSVDSEVVFVLGVDVSDLCFKDLVYHNLGVFSAALEVF